MFLVLKQKGMSTHVSCLLILHVCIFWSTEEGKHGDGIRRNASWESGQTEQTGISSGSDLAGTGTGAAGALSLSVSSKQQLAAVRG